MKRSHIILFGSNAFGTGLLAPVLSLVLLTHGATMETLSLCIGIFAAAVVVLELPSGILADLIGRKRIFLISSCFMIVNYALLLFGSNFLLLAAACAMQGIGRAFSSGSIESLEIDAYMELYDGKNLEKINSSMAVIESVGLAAGSVTGGLLGFLDASYGLLLASAIFLQTAILLMTIYFIKEPACEKKQLSPRIRFREQLRDLAGSLKHSPSVTVIVFMAAACGTILCTVEVYWQPTLTAFLPDSMDWILGIVTCLGYLGVTLGSKAVEAVLSRKQTAISKTKAWQAYWLLRFLLVAAVSVLGFSRRTWLFLLLFVLVYAILGAGNLIENTIFHEAVLNGQRASMMSLLSLSTRAGGLLTSLFGSLIVTGLSLSFVWLLLPLFSAAIIGGIMAVFYRKDMCIQARTPKRA